jgi:pyrroloquinoline quinone biosynthesis protein D
MTAPQSGISSPGAREVLVGAPRRGPHLKSFPQARVDLRSVDLGSEILIYDERNKLVHILNATARRMWQLCDGTHGVEEIVEEVRRLFPQVSAEQIETDVGRALEDLAAKELVVMAVREVDE